MIRNSHPFPSKLVLLPGLDGSGELFAPLLSFLQHFECQIISLPNTTNQNYQFLAEYVLTQLPKDDFILLAESFSGPIAILLSQQRNKNLKGIILVATFISPPRKHLVLLTKILPIKILLSLPFGCYLYSYLFFDNNLNLFKLLKQTINTIPTKILKQRLNSIQSLGNLKKLLSISSTPALYIQPISDLFVSNNKYHEISKYYDNITLKKIDGSHFIAQVRPRECSAIISEFMMTTSK